MSLKQFTLSSAIVLISLINYEIIPVSSSGSTTFLTNNGFPNGFLDSIVNNDIVKNKLKSRWRWEVWDVIPGVHSFNIYVFNITNPSTVEKGGKPQLQQLGPYVYIEHRIKFNVTVDLDLRVNYERNFSYSFDPSQSKGSEDDLINTLNIPFIIFSTLVSAGSDPREGNLAVNHLLLSGESLVKKSVKVGNLIFNGIDVTKYSKYVKLMGPSTLTTQEFESGSYAILKLKSGHHEGAYTVDSGLKDPSKVGKIITWNYLDKLNWWSGDKCNVIEGTEGSVFAPNLQTSDILHTLDLDLCRSIALNYQTPSSFRTITTSLFTPIEAFLQDARTHKENLCFCKEPGNDGRNCLKRGVTDVSQCRDGAPFAMSFPHFFDADEGYLKNVSGLNSSRALHETHMEVELTTGSVVSWNKKFQTNIWLKRIPGIDFFQDTEPIIFPILWNNDIFTLTEDKVELLEEQLASLGGGRGSGNNVHGSKWLLTSITGCSLVLFNYIL